MISLHSLRSVFLILPFLLAGFLTPAWGSESPSDVERAYQEADAKGQYLRAWHLLKKGVEKHPQSSLRERAAQYAPLVGATKEGLRLSDPLDSYTSRPPEDLAGLRPVDAIEAIVDEARKTRVVILNEAHTSSRTRVFAHQLALELAKEGYTHMACEAFTGNIYSATEYGYPSRNGGTTYLQDVFFADMVRQSLRAGMRPIHYEASSIPKSWSKRTGAMEAIIYREQTQAENIVRRFFARFPEGKLFMHVGHSHAAEKPQIIEENGVKEELHWMAARLARLTGLDPLTIDQTTLLERSSPQFENPAYHALRDSGWFQGEDSIVIAKADGQGYASFGPYKGKMDMQVAHPPSIWIEGRPSWMRLGGYRREIEIDPSWIPEAGEALLQAYVKDELEEPIAMDRVLVTEGTEWPPLLLPPGSYRITRQDEEGIEYPVCTISVE